MESPDCCFRCGKIGHHKQACSAHISESEQYLISRLCKRIHKEFKGSSSKSQINLTGLENYPIIDLENALNKSIDFYFGIQLEIENLGYPSVFVCQAKKLKTLHHEQNMKILAFRKTDRDLLAYCKKRLNGKFTTDEERDYFQWKIEDFSLLRHDTYNLSNKLTLWCVNAVASAYVFWNMESKIKGWFDSLNVNLERSTISSIETCKNQCNRYGTFLGVMVRESRNLQNICDKEEVKKMMKTLKSLQIRMNSIRARNLKEEIQFKTDTLEAQKRIFKEEIENAHGKLMEEMNKKLSCILCESNPKEWALICGHMYCLSCIEELEQNQTCDGIPWVDERTGQSQVYHQVGLPKECAFCKGSLAGKIKLIF